MKNVAAKTKFDPVLIANRGEIAIRIARTAKKLGFPVVMIYSESDKDAEHIRYGDFAINIGGEESKDSYLVIEKIIDAAKRTGAKYIHPGYGFLSERPKFVQAVQNAGLVFVGPSADSMEQMGDKITARKTVDALSIPRVPGSAGAVSSAEEAMKFANQVGYPVLLKATAGGGGKGMRRVDNDTELKTGFDAATRESLAAFGDGSLYVEKFILEPHHVEIQVFGNGKGKCIHLGERECSIQRRHQKVWEESPAPILEDFPDTRIKMFDASIKIAESIKYAGAGTFEYIVDGQGNFYFLEMNTRLQVEHPVSEWVTGVDLVEWQLLLAAEKFELPSSPDRRGASIEVRIYAEDSKTFLPAPGDIYSVRQPNGPFLRWDTCYTEKGSVNRVFDPMIGKLSVWGKDRQDAIGRMRVALDEALIQPVQNRSGKGKSSLKTNVDFLRRLVRCSDVVSGNTPTNLIENNKSLVAPLVEVSEDAAIACALWKLTAGTVSLVGGDQK